MVFLRWLGRWRRVNNRIRDLEVEVMRLGQNVRQLEKDVEKLLVDRALGKVK